MLTLYVRTGCPYCARVLQTGEELGVHFTLKNASVPGVSEELTALGGKEQYPYLVDEERGVSMYESEDIIAHLHETFTPES